MRHTTNTKFLTGVLSLSLLAVLTAPADSEAASLSLNRKKLTLRPGKSYTLKIRGSKSKKVKWKSANKKIATVNRYGKVTARRTGKVKVKATVKNKKLICLVTVKNRKKPVSGPMETPPSATAAPKPTATPKPTASQKPSTPGKPPAQKPTVTQVPKPTTIPKPTTVPKPDTPTGSVTETSAYSVLNSLRSTYPEGMPLNNSYYYFSPRFGNGYGCYGFAAKLSDTVFGTEKSYQTHSSFDRIRVGDNIRIGNSHSVIVLTKSSGHITVVEGNYNSSVHWDRKITASSLSSSGFRVYTRY